MRHKDREIVDRELIDSIIRSGTVMRLALSRYDQPYLVPVCFGYDGTRLFFHTGLRGQKVDFLRANPRVCFEFEGPSGALPHDSLGCKWSFSYRTVIGTGLAVEIQDPHERGRGLDQIMRQYSGKADWVYDPAALARTLIWRIDVVAMTGRQYNQG
jgi:uncharacterized protein